MPFPSPLLVWEVSFDCRSFARPPAPLDSSEKNPLCQYRCSIVEITDILKAYSDDVGLNEAVEKASRSRRRMRPAGRMSERTNEVKSVVSAFVQNVCNSGGRATVKIGSGATVREKAPCALQKRPEKTVRVSAKLECVAPCVNSHSFPCVMNSTEEGNDRTRRRGTLLVASSVYPAIVSSLFEHFVRPNGRAQRTQETRCTRSCSAADAGTERSGAEQSDGDE